MKYVVHDVRNRGVDCVVTLVPVDAPSAAVGAVSFSLRGMPPRIGMVGYLSDFLGGPNRV